MKITLGDYIVEINERTTKNNQHRVLTSSQKGIVSQDEYFNKQIASKDNTGYKIVKKGQFTYRAMSDTGRFYINRLIEYDVGIVSPAYPVFEVIEKNIIYTPYIVLFFESDYFQAVISNQSTGSTRVSLKLDKIKRITLDVPSYQEQKEIVERIESTKRTISARTEQLFCFDNLVKSRFIELFGDPASNPKDWKTKSLLDMGYCKNGMNFHTGDSGIEMHCLGVGDFKDLSVIDGTEHLPIISLNEAPPVESMLKDGDIVFVRSNGNKALVGRCLVVYPHNTPTTYSGFCIRYRLTSNEVNTTYLLRVLKTDSMRKKMVGRGANIQNLNQQILATLDIPLPPIEQQQQFAAFVEQTDKSKLAVQKALEELEILKKSLMQQYFG